MLTVHGVVLTKTENLPQTDPISPTEIGERELSWKFIYNACAQGIIISVHAHGQYKARAEWAG